MCQALPTIYRFRWWCLCQHWIACFQHTHTHTPRRVLLKAFYLKIQSQNKRFNVFLWMLLYFAVSIDFMNTDKNENRRCCLYRSRRWSNKRDGMPSALAKDNIPRHRLFSINWWDAHERMFRISNSISTAHFFPRLILHKFPFNELKLRTNSKHHCWKSTRCKRFSQAHKVNTSTFFSDRNVQMPKKNSVFAQAMFYYHLPIKMCCVRLAAIRGINWCYQYHVHNANNPTTFLA